MNFSRASKSKMFSIPMAIVSICISGSACFAMPPKKKQLSLVQNMVIKLVMTKTVVMYMVKLVPNIPLQMQVLMGG